MKAAWGVWLAVLVPNLALAMGNCESKAHSKFQKQAVEIEMASITGEVSSIELVSRRESLQKRLEREQAHCIRPVKFQRAYASAEAQAF